MLGSMLFCIWVAMFNSVLIRSFSDVSVLRFSVFSTILVCMDRISRLRSPSSFRTGISTRLILSADRVPSSSGANSIAACESAAIGFVI